MTDLGDFGRRSLLVHEELRGKIGLYGKLPLRTRDDLAVAYTPGVAAPCRDIAARPARARELTLKANSVAVVTDGSSVLGLGNIGPLAAIPVMEGKALLFRRFAKLDAWPICLDTQDTDEIVDTVRRIAPVFGGINLEDISAPRCFEIEARLQDIGIPVFHDDQHGTAIVVLAALVNAAKITGRRLGDLHVVVNGAGAAGTAVARLLRDATGARPDLVVNDVIVCDSRGAIHRGRDNLAAYKRDLLQFANRDDRSGDVHAVLEGADVFIGVSKGDLLSADDIRRMAKDPIVLAMANPDPEILPAAAHDAGAAIVGTGRSDLPNQVNNVLAFPGVFRGAIDGGATRITDAMKVAAALALAEATEDPGPERILPDPLDEAVAPQIARAVAAEWRA